MFNLPGIPSPRAEIHELADFLEFQSWKNQHHTTSKREIQALLGRLDENDGNEGCDDDDDRTADSLDEALTEISKRFEVCGASYPFILDGPGNVLRHDPANVSPGAVFYKYLLLSTRLNMNSNKMHQGIDGTALLEEWGALVLRQYLGTTRAKSFVFGTAEQGQTFREKVDYLHAQVREGGTFRNVDGADVPVTAKDAKLDVVAWLPFADGHPGLVTVFAQCKTGTSWHDRVSELHPGSFIAKWMSGPFVVLPLRAFVVAEAVNRKRIRSLGLDAGILFDRCRLVDCLPDAGADLLGRTNTWVEAARASVAGSP